MREQMRHVYKVMLIIMVMLLQACGSDDKKAFSISADITTARFSNEFLQASTDTIAIQVTYEGDGLIVGFAPETDPVAWLEYRTANVTENAATIFIDVINAQFMFADSYNTKIRIAVSNDDASNFAAHDIDISLLVWNLAVDTQKVKYSGTFGDASIASQTIAIASESNQWTASTDVSWLSLDITSGTGDGVIEVTPDVSSFVASGLQQGNIILTEATSGDSKLIPVELALDNVYLFAQRSAVALTSTASISALQTTVAISNNGVLPVSWQASTTANWLTVTPLDDNQLQISADPNIAPLNATSSAEVIVSAGQGAGVISETIKVNFYSSDLVVENKVLAALEINNNEMLASPLNPVFYVGVGNQLLTYHQYTGELEASLVVAPENTVLEQFIMHPNGDYLLTKAIETITEEDETTTEIVHRYRINLLDNSIIEILDADIAFEPTDIVRLSGRYFVVTQTLEFADENLQRLFWDIPNAYFASEIDVATQANTLFSLDNNAVSFKRYTPQINDFGDDRIGTTLTHEYHPESLAEGLLIRDFIVTDDEANIYAISETSEWLSFDGETFIDNGLLETNENVVTLFLEKDSASQPNYLRIDITSPNGFYLDSYDSQQTITATVLTQGSQPSSIKVSSDDQRLLINVDSSNNPEVDSKLELVTLSQ
ncbi:MAG: BACON domain-containing protein [Colwellia sp.]|nr:BACON domain-containing protein [Colwellia sp.]